MDILGNLFEYSTTDRIAAFDGKREMSFQELWYRSEAIANWLIVNHPGHAPIALFGDKDNNVLCSIVAAIKSGHPYVCIPDYYPEGKVDAILSDCKPELVFNISEKLLHNTDFKLMQNTDLEMIVSQYSSLVNIDRANYTKSNEVLCILYTSGSSGKPKGVVLTRANMEAKIDNAMECFKDDMPSENGKALNLTAFSFSASFTDLYYFFFQKGCTLYCVPRNIITDIGRLLDMIISINPHMMICTPTLAERFMVSDRFSQTVMTDFRFILLGGEPLPIGIAQKIRRRFPDIQIINGYGTTETAATPISCHLPLDLIESKEAYMPIGYATEDTVYLMDDEGEIISEDNKSGELIVCHKAVSPGYLNRQDQTKAAFFTDSRGRWCFRTGDVMKYKEGYIYCLGRKDHQVKLGGNRFELEDVEAHIRSIDNVKECAAALFTLSDGSKNLMAFIVRKDSDVPKMKSIMELKLRMKQEMESYMIPAKIVFVDSLPKNENMKLDRIKINKMAEEV